MKLTSWLSASACFTVVLLVDTPFSLLRRWQDAEEGKNDGTVQGERCDQHVLCVKTRCNYGKWRGHDDTCKRLDRLECGVRAWPPKKTVLVRYFESKPGLDFQLIRLFLRATAFVT